MQVLSYLHLVLEAQDETDNDESRSELRSSLSGSLTELRPLMTRYLPPGIASALYPAEDAPPRLDWDAAARDAAAAWCAAWKADWDRACRLSHETFLSIKDALPEALQQFRETFSLHDARIISVNSVEDAIILSFDCAGCLTHAGALELRFRGVEMTEELTSALRSAVWLYDELELTDSGCFDWKALLHGFPHGLDCEDGILALHEIRIAARSFDYRHTD
ncbi:DUF4085 family protein [Paenibacillus mucilaginosus]|nr:DUF4085 family protein [Paenibacillus mucilaginosus]MCG7214001.1 DUF4085 domain-containing protein [Paenibacillus mucilaginosus]WDM26001.1 DUF4085 family protein [Paenibacillus mucilaginosus]